MPTDETIYRVLALAKARGDADVVTRCLVGLADVQPDAGPFMLEVRNRRRDEVEQLVGAGYLTLATPVIA